MIQIIILPTAIAVIDYGSFVTASLYVKIGPVYPAAQKPTKYKLNRSDTYTRRIMTLNTPQFKETCGKTGTRESENVPLYCGMTDLS